ncbi:helix-turn-helix transcriptional regulator [Domibacillus aminovorans]|uniref:HTH luxR-type domain-containing protein n=1 Tax=Domibacillus aminovorans TaxID=29332 RepID=A0A177KZD1_9BACI|nr:LuxR C-terminal-related transcriptional regulator [Domibacillus aminovorans]OAH58778.1 hypothetical protein AWH49_03630 [Domibacillus aminovorans]
MNEPVVEKKLDLSIAHLVKSSGIDLLPREAELLDSLLLRLSNDEISQKIFLSVGTAKNYLTILYKKLNVSNRAELMAFMYALFKKINT